jgi:hypothetical protein
MPPGWVLVTVLSSDKSQQPFPAAIFNGAFFDHRLTDVRKRLRNAFLLVWNYLFS